MTIEFDPDKDAKNYRKHGISLRAALGLFDGPYVEVVDERSDYRETRMIATGPLPALPDKLFVAVYTWRGEARRIISFRKANDREIRKYRDRHP